jgi:DNA-binding NarL/FixJ family response regulator
MLSFERPARIFLADEHPIFLAGLRFCLAEQPHIDVIGEAHSSAHLAQVIEKAAPDVAVVSESFNGVSVAEGILNDLPSQRVLVVAEELDNMRAHQLLALGARGYVLKQSPGSVICKAIATVLRGGLFLDAADAVQTPAGRRRGSALTNREQEVLRLIALGFSIREAAERIGITTKSAETYKARASNKLSIDSRQQIVRYAITKGWFQ